MIHSFETSGTTGEPKTVTHTLDAMMANAKAFNEVAGLGQHTRMYHCLPRTHMAGFLNTMLCPMLAGGTVVFGPTFSAQAAMSFWLEQHNAKTNTVWVTPTTAAMLVRLRRSGMRPIETYAERLNSVFCGTAPLPRKVREEWLDVFRIPLQESYGTSEHMLVSVQSKEDALTEHNVGRPIPGVTVEIGDNSEVMVNGTPTGDRGEMKDGKLTITGRIKDLIIRGGFNVSPVQIEEVIRAMPGVRDAAVVGCPDEFWGEMIIAFAEGDDLDRQTIFDSCRQVLPKTHWPDRVWDVEKLPRNEMGKVRKGELLRMLSE